MEFKNVKVVIQGLGDLEKKLAQDMMDQLPIIVTGKEDKEVIAFLQYAENGYGDGYAKSGHGPQFELRSLEGCLVYTNLEAIDPTKFSVTYFAPIVTIEHKKASTTTRCELDLH